MRYTFANSFPSTMVIRKKAKIKKGHKNKQLNKRLIIKYILLFFLIVTSLFAILFGAVYIGIFGPLPTKTDLESIKNEESSLILASDSSVIGRVFAENRTNIRWDEVPKHLVDALVSTEDKRYFSHQGVDGRSILRVLFKSILLGDRNAGGGSTLSQQLIKNLFGRDDHSFMSMPVNKIRESIIATRLEEMYSKEEILLLYFNSVPFGEEVYGIEVAASRYFGKHAKELNTQESAVLVGLLKANTYYSPRLHPENALKRRNQILELMADEGYLTPMEKDSLEKTPLGLNYSNLQINVPAGYFVHQVKKQAREILNNLNDQNLNYDLEKDGLRVYTTLNTDLQKMAEAAVKKQLAIMQPLLDKQLKQGKARAAWLRNQPDSIKKSTAYNKPHPIEMVTPDGIKTLKISYIDSLWYYTSMLQAAVLITDPVTGEVLTWVGGNNFRTLPYDQVLAKRQAASTFKPLMYAAALEVGYTPCTYLGNSQKTYDNYENWSPENYDHTSSEDTQVALWYALAHSMNLPTIDLYFKVGHEVLLNLCNRLNVEIPLHETPSLALGTAELSLLEMVKIYGTFARKGVFTEDFMMIKKIEDANGQVLWQQPGLKTRQIISHEITDELTAMLQTAIDSGTGTRMRTTYGLKCDLAGKTGTAQNYTDAWFMAYTPKLVVGVRVGASDPSIHFINGLGSGSALALPIAGTTLHTIESDSKLRAEYLVPFYISADTTTDCPAFREKGVEGFFNRLFGKDLNSEDERKEALRQNKDPDKKNRTKVGRFFNRLFKGKKK